MAATAYLCHFSAPDFLQSVGKNLKDYQRITALGFASVGVINIIILAAGFLTFGGNCAGVILNSYAQTDVLASVSRFLMLLSVLGSYPFCLSGAKTSLYNLWNFFVASKKKKDVVADDDESDASAVDEPFTVSPRANHIVTVAMLAAITLPSLILKNAGLVVSFNGATMGSAITYIFPSMLVLAKLKKSGSTGFSKTKLINRLVLAFGWTAAIAGGTCSILSAYAPHMLR
jgi:sodium-coupled neutral amino acid transporter 11